MIKFYGCQILNYFFGVTLLQFASSYCRNILQKYSDDIIVSLLITVDHVWFLENPFISSGLEKTFSVLP